MGTYTKEIKSLQHPIVKHLFKLRKNKKYSLEKKQLVIEGKKIITEYPGPIDLLLTCDDSSFISSKIRSRIKVSIEIIKKLSSTKSPEPFIAQVQRPENAPLEKKKRILCLDEVKDPGNVGTLIRSATAFGFDGVFLTSHSADPFMCKALSAARGATFRIPIMIAPLNDLLKIIKKNNLTPFFASKYGDKNVFFKKPFVLILGNESFGATKTLENISHSIGIKISDDVESLNVAVAGSILMNKFQESLWQK